MHVSNTSVAEFIKGTNKTFITPSFQSEYSIDLEYIDELLARLYMTTEYKDSHYLGDVLYYKFKNNSKCDDFIIIDGQKRIVSLLLILCVIRDTTLNDQVKQDIDKNYLCRQNNVDVKHNKILLKYGSTDNRDFNNVLYGSDNAENDNNHFTTIYKHIKSEINKEAYMVDKLFKSIEKADVVLIDFTDCSELQIMQTIFDKLFAQKAKVTSDELIKYILFMHPIYEEQEVLYRRWNELETILKNDNMEDFITYFLISRHFKLCSRENNHLEFLKWKVESGWGSEQILERMVKYAEIYTSFHHYNSFPNELMSVFEDIEVLNADYLYPVILLLFERLSRHKNQELVDSLKVLVDYIIRVTINRRNNDRVRLGLLICNLCKGLNSLDIQFNSNGISKFLSMQQEDLKYLTDDELYEFIVHNDITERYAKIILKRIENDYYQGGVADYNQVAISYIMPNILSDSWRSSLGNSADYTHKYYLNKLGNMVLLLKSDNRVASNSPFASKRKVFIDSKLSVNKDLKNYTSWTRNQMDDRTQKLAKLACSCIKGPNNVLENSDALMKRNSMENENFIMPSVVSNNDKEDNSPAGILEPEDQIIYGNTTPKFKCKTKRHYKKQEEIVFSDLLKMKLNSDIEVTGGKVQGIQIFDKNYNNISYAYEVIVEVYKYCSEVDKVKFDKFYDQHSKKLKTTLFNSEPKDKKKTVSLGNGYYINKNKNFKSIISMSLLLAKYYNIVDDIDIFIKVDTDRQK